MSALNKAIDQAYQSEPAAPPQIHQKVQQTAPPLQNPILTKEQKKKKETISDIPKENVKLVMDQSACTQSEAEQALISQNGDIVNAIIALTS